MNDKDKCHGQDENGGSICSGREYCDRYVRPAGDRQFYSDFWKAGDSCQHYVSISKKQSNSEKRMDVIGQNGNVGYE